ncbi:methyltransferase, FkbM family [Rhizobium sp. RU20A]|uniref:FkbM family methyltransferase n=1 Tax=Rhizobium sp. RU20A TaxID=1907412 RepID=UPI000954837C|nr:FkbM family methyltransferase [Rhizobium sp. RU20A]SIQ59988.1 methyltransferase, FkbM family [Rhizobium sp. RU20A]
MTRAQPTKTETPAASLNDVAAHAHPERHFAGLPDAATARALLETIAAQTPTFAPERADRPVVLYGAGNLGRLARDHLRLVGLDFTLVVDRNADTLKDDPAWQGVTLMTPDAVPDSIKATALLAVSISTVPFVPLEAQLMADGWHRVVPFYDLAETFRDRHPLSNGWFAGAFSDDDLHAMTAVLDGWDDDISRAHHLQFIAWRRLRAEWSFAGAPMPSCARFFIPEVRTALDPAKTFLDLGAHHGSVVEAYLDAIGADGNTIRPFGGILAVEPDAANRAALLTLVSRLPSHIAERIIIENDPVDAMPGRRRFHSGLGYASQLSETGSEIIRTTTIDALAANLPAAPGFIKLHLEGAERDALLGGLATIRQHRPIIAVTVYHDADGLYRTAKVMMETLDGYRFLFRLHGWCGTGAVVYALPMERSSRS